MSRIAMLNGLGRTSRRRRPRAARRASYAMHGPIATLGAGEGNGRMLLIVGALVVGAFFLLRKKDATTP